jgi:hypothetical protein
LKKQAEILPEYEKLAKEIARLREFVPSSSSMCHIPPKPPKPLQPPSNYNTLLLNLTAIDADIDECLKGIEEERTRQMFVDYALEHFSLNVAKLPMNQLILKCNKHHHKEELKKTIVYEKGHEDCKPDCFWQPGNKRCNCGNYKGWRWCVDDVDFSDPRQYTPNTDGPAGEACREW